MVPGGYQVSGVVRFGVRCREHEQALPDASSTDW